MTYGRGVAWHRAKYPTRCMVCGTLIEAGHWIVKLADDRVVESRVKTKSAWSHPICLQEALRTGSAGELRSASMAYRLRQRRRLERSRRARSSDSS